MPNATTVVLNDGTADITFSPDSITGTHYQLQNLDSGMADREILHFDRPANDGKETTRRAIRVNVPYTETVGDTSVQKMATVKVEVIVPASAPSSVRKQVRELGVSAASSTVYAAMVESPEWVW